MTGAGLTVSALNVFPIKGCRGIALTRTQVDHLGLQHDRRLMLVDADGRFLSQRELPALATLIPDIADGAIRIHGPDRRD